MGINRKYIIAGMLATASVMSFSDVQQSHALEFRVTTTRVHFRTGAGINYSSMGVLSKGVKVTYIGESGNWTKVEYNSKTGYICSDYLEKSHTPSTETMYTTPSIGLNLRRGPGTTYSVITTLQKGTEVKVLSTHNNWCEIKVNGLKGYVSKDYLSKTNPSTSNEEIPTQTTTKYVSTNAGLNLRKGPGTNYAVITTLPKNTAVTVYSTENNWSKVKVNSMEGYVSNAYLSEKKTESSSASNPTPSTPVKGSIDEVLNLANQLLGKPYVWGATGPDSFDCSGFTQYIYKHGANITIPRVSSQQGNFGTTVSRNNLKAGDLVFFDTNGINDGNISHLGIYDGNGNLIHSSFSVKKIVKVPLNTSYWNSTFVTAKRIL